MMSHILLEQPLVYPNADLVTPATSASVRIGPCKRLESQVSPFPTSHHFCRDAVCPGSFIEQLVNTDLLLAHAEACEGLRAPGRLSSLERQVDGVAMAVRSL